MKRRVFMIVGSSFIIMSFIILLNSFQTVTGYSVFENVDINAGYYAGLWLLISGFVVLRAGTSSKKN
ncbi:hypothetical protein KW787_03135 [Candidatus Pacearchaeota archaeon]|nr:hypothetical protein [Candidatus Pacearchaeota archaeon]